MQPHAALTRARVLVVGGGGLGNPAALALARAGIGHIGLVDSDAVDLSNLPRQILFRDDDIGTPKVDAATARLRFLAPDVDFTAHRLRLTPEASGTAADLLRAHDFVIDATDSIDSKYFLNDLALATDRPLAHAGVTGDRGQLLTVLPGRSACLRCLFPGPADAGPAPGCSEAGVFGPLVGVFGALQAGEAIKFCGRTGTLFSDRLLLSDRGRWRTLTVRRDPECVACARVGAGLRPG
jgi:adenylyltransferase/sulfurtransferase